jgi:pyridoxine 4-dehydrogenase
MGMSDLYGDAERAESLATIRAALDAGVTLLDTGDFYGSGHNELLLREALEGRRRDEVTIAVKFGVQRDPGGAFLGVDNRPAAVKNALAQTLRRLGTDYVDVYQPARVTPDVPIEDTIGAIADLVAAGWVRHVALSEAGAATLRRAHAVHPLVALQIEWSLLSRSVEAEILPAARALGVAVNPYGALSRGLLSGHWSRERSARGRDFRSHLPRFSGEHLERNLTLVEELRRLAEARGATVAQLAVAWVLARGDDVVPLVGARNRVQLREALGALDVTLGPDDLAHIERAVPADAASGSRYDAAQMAMLDSER